MTGGKELDNLLRGKRARIAIVLGVATYVVAAMVISLMRSAQATQEAQGVLVDVQSRQIVNADTVTLRDPSGATRSFRVSPEVASNREHPNTASHLRQHMVNADPVIVRYRETAEGPVAVRIIDAD